MWNLKWSFFRLAHIPHRFQTYFQLVKAPLTSLSLFEGSVLPNLALKIQLHKHFALFCQIKTFQIISRSMHHWKFVYNQIQNGWWDIFIYLSPFFTSILKAYYLNCRSPHLVFETNARLTFPFYACSRLWNEVTPTLLDCTVTMSLRSCGTNALQYSPLRGLASKQLLRSYCDPMSVTDRVVRRRKEGNLRGWKSSLQTETFFMTNIEIRNANCHPSHMGKHQIDECNALFEPC